MVGTQIIVRLNPPLEPDNDTVNHFLASVNGMFELALQVVRDGDMLGMAFHKEDNQNDNL